MKIIWLKNGAGIGYGYFKDDTFNTDEKTANVLIKKGYCAVHTEVSSDLPPEIPGREALEEAGVTLKELHNYTVEQLVEFKGIGESTAKKIVEFLAK